MKDLDGKVAVITGGASGIGLAMAEAFAAEGMRLVIADIQQDTLDQAVAGLAEAGYEAIGVRTDVADFGSVEALREAALAAFGKVHVLVNNAGVSITGPLWEMTLDDWRWVHGVNVWGIIHGIKAFVPLLLAQGEPAHVVNTASIVAFNGIGEHSPYCSSKAAALSISQSLYSELVAANTQVAVSVVCPGMVDTQIHKSNRNRPQGDRAWSDREWNDAAHVEGAAAFQGRGAPAAEVARATLAAVKAGRFYVFSGEGWRPYVRIQTDAAAGGANPPVASWGPDLRDKPDTPAFHQVP